MEIKLEQSETRGAFYIEQEGKRVAFMEFSKAGNDRIIISHTQVDNVLRGKNAGKQLVAAAVEHARKNNIKIVPLCPFARSVFDKVKEYSDVL
ncbi:MAG: N-acetyltransferase [Cyclobacteriaceae bacterium]|nr:N-acetyltransferase [Cyclobacteriaceae bacterium]